MEPPEVVVDVVERVAAREGLQPEDLEVRLNDVVDVDALEHLTTRSGSRNRAEYLRVEFMYCGYEVTVDGQGRVNIDEPPREGSRAELERREVALQQAAAIMGDPKRTFDEQVDAIVEVLRNAVGTSFATFSYVNDDRYVFESLDVLTDVDLQGGETVPLADLPNCAHVVETEQTLVLEDVEAEAPELADSTWGIASYLGAPVFVGDAVYGTLCCYGMEPRDEAFTEWDVTFLELLSAWVSTALDRRARERSVRKATLEKEAAAGKTGTWELAHAHR